MKSAVVVVLAAGLLQLAWGFAPLSPLVDIYCNRAESKSTRHYSIPTSFDTLTSGLASIARLPHGVSVAGGISTSGPASKFLPKILKLYDVENDINCRTVREKITKFDLVVKEVIPAASNSRRVNEVSTVPTMVASVDGKEMTFSGVDDILNFLNDKFSTDKEMKYNDDESIVEDIIESSSSSNDEVDIEKTLLQIKDTLLESLPGILRAGKSEFVLFYYVKSTCLSLFDCLCNPHVVTEVIYLSLSPSLISGRGQSVCNAACINLSPPRPSKPLVLYSYEGNQFCRLVREVLTELDVTYELRSAGKQSPRRDELASITGGSSQCPYIIDPNTGIQMAESKDIIEYLYTNYSLWTPPSELLRSVSNVVTPLLAPLYKVIAPLQAGSSTEDEDEYIANIAEAKADIYEEISSKPVVIYTYELSPFCSEAVSVLRSLSVNFNEISLGKEWIPGLLEQPAKRAALLEITCQSSLPNIFVGGESIGGLYSGNPGLVPALEEGTFIGMVDEAKRSM